MTYHTIDRKGEMHHSSCYVVELLSVHETWTCDNPVLVGVIYCEAVVLFSSRAHRDLPMFS